MERMTIRLLSDHHKKRSNTLRLDTNIYQLVSLMSDNLHNHKVDSVTNQSSTNV